MICTPKVRHFWGACHDERPSFSSFFLIQKQFFEKFSFISNFNKVFRNQIKMSPTEFAKNKP